MTEPTAEQLIEELTTYMSETWHGRLMRYPQDIRERLAAIADAARHAGETRGRAAGARLREALQSLLAAAELDCDDHRWPLVMGEAMAKARAALAAPPASEPRRECHHPEGWAVDDWADHD